VDNLVFQLCVSAVAGWVNRGQQQVIECRLEENRVLHQHLGGRRLRLTRTQRCRLAVRAKAIGRQALMGLGNALLTPLPANSNADGSIQCRERLGGVLNYFGEAA
jgi:hypothetical protein